MERFTAGQLASERLLLEPLRPEHAEELAPVLDDPSLHRFTGGEPASLAELRARYERQAGGRSPDGRQRWLNWAVRERSTTRAVGTVQATVDTDDPELAELAWIIVSTDQGRGFAKEASGVVATWLRGRGVRRLQAHIHPRHDASMAVARSLGLAPTDVMQNGEVLWQT